MSRSILMSLNLQLWRNTSFLVPWTWPSQRKMRTTMNLNHSSILMLKTNTAVLSEIMLLFCMFSHHFEFCSVTEKVLPISPQIHQRKNVSVQRILAVLELDHKSWLSKDGVLSKEQWISFPFSFLRGLWPMHFWWNINSKSYLCTK